MKSLLIIVTYIGTFIFLYLLLSLIGMIWVPYHEVIADVDWFAIYGVFLGSWMAFFPAREVYCINREYFKEIEY